MNEQMTLPASTRSAGAAARVAEVVGDSLAGRRIVENFALLVEAAGSVPKLRQLVLTLAVSGRLSQQKANDGTAAALLASLAGKSSTPRKAKLACAPVEQDAGPFVFPHSWCWARFPDVASIDSHLVDPAGFVDLPHVAPDNIEKGTGRLMEYRTIREDGVTSSKHRFFSGQIVYSKIRPNLSKVVVVDFDGLCSADMYPLTAKIDRGYLHCFMLSQVFLDQVVREDNRLAMPKVNQEQLAATLVAVPPLAEQKRIVAKVDQLMTLCDDLEARQNKKREVGARLTKSALEALTTAEGAEDFDAAWKRVVENFDVLIDRAEKVGALRRAVLEAGVRGSLVRQQDSDESVETLWKRIGGERTALLEGKRRGGKGQGSAHTELLPEPHPIPKSWRWCQLGDVAGHIVDGTHHTPNYREKGVAFISAKDIKGGKLVFDKCRYVSEEEFTELAGRCCPKPGDVLVTKSGSIGEVAIVDTDRRFTLFESVALIPVVPSVDQRFVAHVAYLGASGQFGKANQKGVGVTHLHLVDLRRLPFPLPPLKEQRRIVAKIDQLMKLCDHLEQHLRRAEDRAHKLVEAVVSQLVA